MSARLHRRPQRLDVDLRLLGDRGHAAQRLEGVAQPDLRLEDAAQLGRHLGRFFRRVSPKIEMVLADPEGSARVMTMAAPVSRAGQTAPKR